MSAEVDKYDDEFDEAYDLIDDLLYRAFITEDVKRLSEGLNAEQKVLIQRIMSRVEKVISGREQLAFKKGLAQGK